MFILFVTVSAPHLVPSARRILKQKGGGEERQEGGGGETERGLAWAPGGSLRTVTFPPGSAAAAADVGRGQMMGEEGVGSRLPRSWIRACAARLAGDLRV